MLPSIGLGWISMLYEWLGNIACGHQLTPAFRPVLMREGGTLIRHQQKNRTSTLNVQRSIRELKRTDESLGAQTGEPALLEILRLLLEQLLFDIRARLGHGLGRAAAFVFDLENVVVAVEVDNVANFSAPEIESDFLERPGQRLAFDPAPVAAEFTGTVFGINLRHAVKLRAIGQF